MMKSKLNIYAKNFILCGLIGWCLECIWTGLASLIHGDRALTCHTSFWMFPIYGMASFIEPIHKHAKHKPVAIRGILYTILIYIVEFVTGCLLKLIHACPWNYSKARHNLKGVIRLDYFPAWFGMGLLYEKILDLIDQIRTKYI